jgi:hypothetical protein
MGQSGHARRAKQWVTLRQAAGRLALSPSQFCEFLEYEGVAVTLRHRQVGVDWPAVESAVARSRVTRVDEYLLWRVDAPEAPSGLA